MRVLLVEDDATLRRLWCEVFEAAGHEAVEADTVGRAREKLLARTYDVAVLDLNLGGESGLSVAALATYANPKCRVVMITGSTLFANGELFEIAPGVSTVLRKPVPIDELIAVSEHSTVGA